MHQDYFLGSIEGVNGIGKGVLKERALPLLEASSVLGVDSGMKPFKTALVTEPPQIPMKYFAHSPSAHSEGKLITWRNMLKEGFARDLLLAAHGGESINLAFADGFLAARSVIEQYMHNEFLWDYASIPPTFIEMLPNFPEIGWGRTGWDKQEFDHIVIKDRGTASTWVFQGEDPEVRDLITKTYANGELRKEDLTVVLMPYDINAWINFDPGRNNDVDVHDAKKQRQFMRYRNLRADSGGIFTKEIVYLQNDPTGQEFQLNTLSALIPLLFIAAKRQGNLSWFDKLQGINSVKVDLHKVTQMMYTARRSIDDFYRSSILPLSWFSNMSYELLTNIKYSYDGVPLSFVSGDMGIVYNKFDIRGNNNVEFILVEDLYEKAHPISRIRG